MTSPDDLAARVLAAIDATEQLARDAGGGAWMAAMAYGVLEPTGAS